jgi:geranylgeranyl diphosphate synthase, type I
MSIVAGAVDAMFVMNCIRSAKPSMSISFAKAYAATATRSPLVTVTSALRSIAWEASRDWYAGSSLREQWRQVSYSTCTHNYFVEEETGGRSIACLTVMTTTPTIQSTLLRYQREILTELRHVLQKATDAAADSGATDTSPFYGQMRYHLGWVDAAFTTVSSNPGKLIRPTLLLLAYEAAGANGLSTDTLRNTDYLSRALPAAAALELTHNFTLIHDDIEDGDIERRHRPTLWKVWGIPQAINTGDGMFALARLALWGILEKGVEPAIAVRLGADLDRACLVLAEGQYLDLSFESRQNLSVAAYVDMIRRKTAALMACAAEMGALLGTKDEETIERLRSFGNAIGIAFQVRDDLLGVWASTDELGKTPAGDIYRRKKSLPILHALEHANPQDQHILQHIYMQETPVTKEQVDDVLAIFARTETRAYCCAFLIEQCRLAHESLASVPRTPNPVTVQALNDMETLVHFVEEAAKG